MVRACKWVDEVVENAPYLTSIEFMDQYNCEYCVHGDDITTLADGSDCYALVKAAGRYLECMRTVGISTTDLVTRMLSIGTTQQLQLIKSKNISTDLFEELIFLFDNRSVPEKDDTVVFVDGDFDLFHIQHLRMLKECHEIKTNKIFLIVGVFSDTEEKSFVMNVHERALNLSSCKYVSKVIRDTDCNRITKEFCHDNRIDFVIDCFGDGGTRFDVL